MKKLWMILIGLFVACQTEKKAECKIDPLFKGNFENSIRIVNAQVKSNSLMIVSDNATVFKAYKVLEALTKVESHEQWEHDAEGTYLDAKQFSEDSLAWQNWYEKNKCHITMDSAEVVFSKARKPLPDYDNPKVMAEVAEMWPMDYADSVRKVDSLQRVKFALTWPRLVHEDQRD